MPLNERQQKEAELYAQGTEITDIAKLCGVARQTIYNDMKRPEWKATVDEYVTQLKKQGEQKIMSKVDIYISELEKIALTSKSENTKKDILIYLLNRIYGLPTSKTQDVSDKKDESVDPKVIHNEFEKYKLKKAE
jgi:predicted DNA-binding protein YlxM (UPF0122 family)